MSRVAGSWGAPALRQRGEEPRGGGHRGRTGWGPGHPGASLPRPSASQPGGGSSELRWAGLGWGCPLPSGTAPCGPSPVRLREVRDLCPSRVRTAGPRALSLEERPLPGPRTGRPCLRHWSQETLLFSGWNSRVPGNWEAGKVSLTSVYSTESGWMSVPVSKFAAGGVTAHPPFHPQLHRAVPLGGGADFGACDFGPPGLALAPRSQGGPWLCLVTSSQCEGSSGPSVVPPWWHLNKGQGGRLATRG